MNNAAHTDLLADLRGSADFWDRPDGVWGAADGTLPAATSEGRQDANIAYRMGTKALRRQDRPAARRWFTLACTQKHPGAAFRNILTGDDAVFEGHVLIRYGTGAGKTHAMLQVLQQLVQAARWGHGDARHLTVSLITPTGQALEAFLRDIRGLTARDAMTELVIRDRDPDYVAEDTEFYPWVRGLLEGVVRRTQSTTADATLSEPSLRAGHHERASVSPQRDTASVLALQEKIRKLLNPFPLVTLTALLREFGAPRNEFLTPLRLYLLDEAHSARPAAGPGGWWNPGGPVRCGAEAQRYSRSLRAGQHGFLDDLERYRAPFMAWPCRFPDCAENTLLRATADRATCRCPRCGPVRQATLVRDMLTRERPVRNGRDGPREPGRGRDVDAGSARSHASAAGQEWRSFARWLAAQTVAESSGHLLVWMDMATSTAFTAAGWGHVLGHPVPPSRDPRQSRARLPGEASVGGALGGPRPLADKEELEHLPQWTRHVRTRVPADDADVLLVTSMLDTGVDVCQLVPVRLEAVRLTHDVRDDRPRLKVIAPAAVEADPGEYGYPGRETLSCWFVDHDCRLVAVFLPGQRRKRCRWCR